MIENDGNKMPHVFWENKQLFHNNLFEIPNAKLKDDHNLILLVYLQRVAPSPVSLVILGQEENEKTQRSASRIR